MVTLVLFAVVLFAAVSGARDATQGWPRFAQQALVLAVLSGYYIASWLRGGQTLAMRAWRIRVVDITPAKAVLRFLYALLLLPTGLSLLWVAFDREGQFLHDRLAGTRLVLVPR